LRLNPSTLDAAVEGLQRESAAHSAAVIAVFLLRQ
jgi:hypothetical protein